MSSSPRPVRDSREVLGDITEQILGAQEMDRRTAQLRRSQGLPDDGPAPEASGSPRRIFATRTPAIRPSSAWKASGAESQTNSTPSSSAFFTSRCEPGMLARSRR